MDDARLIGYRRVTASGVVSKTPCLLYSICGIGIGDTSNVYTVHDGQSTGGKVKMRLVAGSYSADFRLYAAPLYFAKGIYIAFTTNGSEVALQFMQLARV